MRQAEAIEVARNAARLLSTVFGSSMRDVYLYGSYARGDFTEQSDVDILVTVDQSAEALSSYRRSVAEISSALSLEHDVTVSITVKPVERFERYSSVLPYYQNVLKEGICVAV